MSNIFTKINAILLLSIMAFGMVISSCNKEEDVTSETQLHSFGPSPALRGGEIKFIGINLDKVTAIELPGAGDVTSFVTHTPTLIVVEVPEETMEGRVTLKTPQGNITAKSMLGISEPVTISSINPASVRPGDVITITGTYLNLVEEVIFPTNKSVTEFESQTQTELQVRVPEDAQSGTVVLSNGAEEPILIESETELDVILPAISSLSPNPVKAGNTLTINGSNLDLVQNIIFGGSRSAAEFEVSEDGNQITVTVPATAEDGNLTLVAPSLVEVESEEELNMLMPTIASVPGQAKTGRNITIEGENLDLITRVTFGGGEPEGVIQEGGSATSISVQVPATAQDSVVTFYTAANKSVASAEEITLVAPTITSVSPMDVKTQENITIRGTDLDVVASVHFEGGTEGTIVSASETELVVTVPPRSQSGVVRLLTTNGTEVVSTESLTIEAGNVPSVVNMPASAMPGEMITIEGMKLDLTTEVIFPGNIKATQFGKKTADLLEVVVPEDTEIGVGRITFVTAEGDVTESPEIEFVGSIKYYIYTDGLASGWDQWGGWGTESQDFANTEMPAKGSTAIKVEYNDSYGAIQLHPTNANVLEGYTHIVISIAGTIEGSRAALQFQDAGGNDLADYPLDLVAGEYVTFEVPISELGGPDAINDLRVKSYGTNPNTIYIDEIGLR